jgi:hypothetical protein
MRGYFGVFVFSSKNNNLISNEVNNLIIKLPSFHCSTHKFQKSLFPALRYGKSS